MKTTKTAVILALVLASASLQAHELSTRGYVGLGDNVMIGGLIVEDRDCDQFTDDGKERIAQFVIRVLGPSLEAAGLANVLQDPQIAFYDEQGNLIGGQMDYSEVDVPSQQIIYNHGLAPTNLHECALYVQIPAGFFTAIVSGQDGGTGIALLEIYKL